MTIRTITLPLAMAALLATAALSPAYAYRGMSLDIPQDKQEQVAKLYREGRQKIAELESRKWNKQGELNSLLAQAKPESSKIEALAKEIGNLSSMIYQERVGLQQRIFKETGVNLPMADGPGRGRGAGPDGCPGGYGAGPGGCAGGYGSGYGPGGCPMSGYGAAPGAGGQNQPPCCQTSEGTAAPNQAPGKTQ